jgi:hypothetical protein
MDEAGRKRKLVAEINALRGGYARRIEDRFAVGVLDLIIKLPEFPWLWAEGKLIDGFKFAPTERQWVEGERILKTGTLALLIGWKGSIMCVSSWTKQADSRQCFSGRGDSVAVLRGYLIDRKLHES